MAERTIDESEALVWIRTIPSDEELHDVSVTNDRTSAQANLTHVVDMTLSDEIVQAVQRTQGQHQGEYHTETRENRTRHEIWWEDRGVPTRQHRKGEVKGDDGMHRKNQRSGDTSQHEVSHLVVAPVVTSIAPAHGSHPIEIFTKDIHTLGHEATTFVSTFGKTLDRTVTKHS